MNIKKCRTCKSEKPVTEYYSHRTTADRLRPDCKACIAAYGKDRYDADPQKIRAINKRWVDRNYTHFRAQQNEYKARIRGK